MEHEGIFYFFEHKENKHIMVLADRPSSHEPCPAQSSARYVSEGGTGENEDGVFGWGQEGGTGGDGRTFFKKLDMIPCAIYVPTL
jgi:type VI secretion system secreted protein VgrG